MAARRARPLAAPLHGAHDRAHRAARAVLHGAAARSGQRESPGVQGAQGDLEALAFSENDVLARNLHVVELDDRVVEGLESHEAASVGDFESGAVGFDNEGGDLASSL